MSNPRVKRPFAGASSDPAQRQITSFFNPRASADLSVESELLQSPPLPANIQSNLLSVGMRVRKSVPEGYKTSTHSAFKLWSDNTPLPRPAPSSASSTSYRAASRELLPFCGINRVGGLDSQPEFRGRLDFEDDEVPGLDDVPELTLSQESTDSAVSSSSMRKRILEDDEDAAGNDSGARNLMAGGGNARPMAVPRSRIMARKTGIAPPAKAAVDQENVTMDGDFEDADFLVYNGGSEVDMME